MHHVAQGTADKERGTARRAQQWQVGLTEAGLSKASN